MGFPANFQRKGAVPAPAKGAPAKGAPAKGAPAKGAPARPGKMPMKGC